MSVNMKAVYGIIGVNVGCLSNMVFLELLVKTDPAIGSYTTFLQFLFISLQGILFQWIIGKKKRQIPIKIYATLTGLFFIVNLFNNMAFNYHIPVPLHMIFRSGSLIANLLMGRIILKKTYSFKKYVSVVLITVGITICTLISGGSGKDSRQPDSLFWWVVGITLLTTALLLSARLGIYQEQMFKVHGKHPEEALFYTHLFSLPGFIFTYNDIIRYTFYSYRPPFLDLSPYFSQVPALWVYLIGNVLTQYICIKSVYVLTTECASLTVTLVITLRKFTSLVFSIWYFKNPFTLLHWFGTILVFGGTLEFTETPEAIYNALFNRKETKEKALKETKKVN